MTLLFVHLYVEMEKFWEMRIVMTLILIPMMVAHNNAKRRMDFYVQKLLLFVLLYVEMVDLKARNHVMTEI